MLSNTNSLPYLRAAPFGRLSSLLQSLLKTVSVTIYQQVCAADSLREKKNELSFCISIKSGKMKDGSRALHVSRKVRRSLFFLEVKNSPMCLICNQTLCQKNTT